MRMPCEPELSFVSLVRLRKLANELVIIGCRLSRIILLFVVMADLVEQAFDPWTRRGCPSKRRQSLDHLRLSSQRLGSEARVIKRLGLILRSPRSNSRQAVERLLKRVSLVIADAGP